MDWFVLEGSFKGHLVQHKPIYGSMIQKQFPKHLQQAIG